MKNRGEGMENGGTGKVYSSSSLSDRE